MKPYLIAEIGVNFFDTARIDGISLLEAAKQYIFEAAKAGVDAVKFQSYKASTIVSKHSPAYWDTDKEPTKTQYELFMKHDHLNREDFAALSAYCREIGVDFVSTPFDHESIDYLDQIQDFYKISSSDLTNIPFLKKVAQKGKPVVLSVGASYLSEVDEAVRLLRENGCDNLTLLHCVLSYPTKYEDANLNFIPHLKRVFPDCKIGYSDHTPPDPSMTVLTTAYLLGAEVIEKHFTLDKTLSGNDHYHAGDPADFARAVQNFQLIGQIRGASHKTVLACEEIPRREARRSIVATRDLKAGERLNARDVMCKRPGTGLSPAHLELIVGRKLRRDVAEDSLLQLDDFIE